MLAGYLREALASDEEAVEGEGRWVNVHRRADRLLDFGSGDGDVGVGLAGAVRLGRLTLLVLLAEAPGGGLLGGGEVALAAEGGDEEASRVLKVGEDAHRSLQVEALNRRGLAGGFGDGGEGSEVVGVGGGGGSGRGGIVARGCSSSRIDGGRAGREHGGAELETLVVHHLLAVLRRLLVGAEEGLAVLRREFPRRHAGAVAEPSGEAGADFV